MTDDNKAPTHILYTLKREGKLPSRWLEIGTARLEQGGGHIFVDRLPVGGWTGYLYAAPKGAPPPALEPQPQRPIVPGSDTGEGD